MVHTSVTGFVRPDVHDEILHSTLPLRHVPILNRMLDRPVNIAAFASEFAAHLDSNIGNRKVGIRPSRKVTLFDFSNGTGVCMNSLLFEITNKSVDNARRQEICDEEAVEEDALCTNNHHLHEPARLTHLHESQKMHSLVVALLEESLDPSIIPFHASEAAEMS